MSRRAAWLLSAVVLVAGFLGVAPAARADSMTYSLTVANSAGSCCTGPYGTLTVDLTSSTTATITFTADNNGGYQYLFGDSSVVDLNVNATSFSESPTATELNSISGFAPSWKDYGTGTVDGFGSFNLTLDNNDGFTNTATSVSFTLTNTSGTWSSASDVLTPNSDGAEFAAHIYACANPCTQTEGAFATFYAAGTSPGTSIPEPATWSMLTMGLAGVAGVGLIWRRRREMLA